MIPPSQRLWFPEGEENVRFKLSDEDVETLREVGELGEKTARALLFLALTCLSSEAAAQQSAETVERGTGRISPKSLLLPSWWMWRKAIWL